MDSSQLHALAGRVFIATLFLASAFGKIVNFDSTAQYMAAHGMPMVQPLCAAAILIEVAGGLSILLGFFTRWGAMLLVFYLIPTTLIFHWGPDQRIQFLKNLAIMGGLLQLAAFGGGELSLDYRAKA